MNLYEHYQHNLRREIVLNYIGKKSKNIPKFDKIVIQHTSRQILMNPESLIAMMLALEVITGQKPTKIVSRKSIANWNVRQGQIIGCKVTLRGNKIYEFLSKLTLIYLPRTTIKPQFSLNAASNHQHFLYNFGLSDLLTFLEIEGQLDTFRSLFHNMEQFGCQIHFVLNNASRHQGISLLRGFLLPIAYNDKDI